VAASEIPDHGISRNISDAVQKWEAPIDQLPANGTIDQSRNKKNIFCRLLAASATSSEIPDRSMSRNDSDAVRKWESPMHHLIYRLLGSCIIGRLTPRIICQTYDSFGDLFRLPQRRIQMERFW
jgi:hypothetical protein